MFQRLKNLWHLSVLQFDAATKEGIQMFDGAGNKIELKKSFPTIKKKPATIIKEKGLQEGVIDEGGDYE